MIYGLLAPLAQRFPKTRRYLARVPISRLVTLYILCWFLFGVVLYLMGVRH